MKKSLLYMAAFASMLTACQNDTVESVVANNNSQSFSGSFDTNESRVYLGDDYYYRWEKGDYVSIFTIDNRNRKYQATTGDVIVTDFEFVSKPSSAPGVSLTEQKSNYAIYPYNESNNASFVTGAYYTLSSKLEAEQTYRSDKIGLGYAIMVSKIPATEKVFTFKNSCALVKLNVKTTDEYADEVKVESIKIESASQKLAGIVTIEVEQNDYTAKIYEAAGNSSNSVTLSGCDEAGTIGTDYKTFFLVIPAGTYPANDLTITIDTNVDLLDKIATVSTQHTAARSEYLEFNATLGGGFSGTFYDYTTTGNATTIMKDFTLTDQALMSSSDLVASMGFNGVEFTYLLEIPSGDYTIDGDGKTLTFDATDANNLAINILATQTSGTGNYNKVTMKNLTIAGELQSTLLGYYAGSTNNYFSTELKNVNVVNTKVVSLSPSIGAAVCVYGTAVLNNCNIYGTTRSELETEDDVNWPIYDLAVVNYTNTTLNGGKYGSIYTWTQCKLTITNAEVESISGTINGRNNKDYGLYISGTSKVGKVELKESTTSALYTQVTIGSEATVNTLILTGENIDYSKIVIESGATVNKIVINNEEKTLDEFNAMKTAE